MILKKYQKEIYKKLFLLNRDYHDTEYSILQYVEQYPKDYWLLTRLSEEYYHQNKISKALDTSQKAKKMAPDHPLVLWDYGCALEALHRYREAILVYKKIVHLNSKNHFSTITDISKKSIRKIPVDSCFTLSLCYEQLGNLEESIFWMRKYIRLKGNLKCIWSVRTAKKKLRSLENRKKIYHVFHYRYYPASVNWHEMVILLREELAIDPEYPFFMACLSTSYEYLKKYKLSSEYIIKALKIYPNDPNYLWSFACVLLSQKKFIEAIEIFKKIVSMGSYRIGVIETQDGEGAARRFINDCRYMIALCYKKAENRKLAKQWIQKHMAARAKGIKSIYTKKEAQLILA